MKLRVIGWTYYDDDLPLGEIGWAARNAVVDDIKQHGYLFSGLAHLNDYFCTPVLNDGSMCCFTQRGWGGVMAEAHGYHGRMDYAKFAFGQFGEADVRPKDIFDEDTFIPEFDLNERFELKVSQKVFDSAKRLHEIKIDDLPELRYLDAGDTLVLTCDNQTADYTVSDVDRKRDLPEDKRDRLEFAFDYPESIEMMKRANEEFARAKIIMIIKLV